MTGAPPTFRQKTLLLLQELQELLQERGALPAEEICRVLLRVPRIQPAIAARIVGEIVSGDRRFRFVPDGSIVLASSPTMPSGPLRAASFTVVDLETTGGSHAIDRILEVGAVRVENGRIGESFASLINPGVPIPPFVASMTGIDDGMVAAAPSFAAVAESLSAFIGETVFVAHNLPFDLGFLNRELERSSGFILSNPSLCTVRLGRRLLPNLPDRRLDTLADYYGFTFAGRHRALGDAAVTARLLLKFIELLEERGVDDLVGVEAFLAGGAGETEERISDGSPRPRPRRPDPSSNGGS
jgi:DNA polymerase III epsilon subunit family exonuclease